jgi:hypothetical protein
MAGKKVWVQLYICKVKDGEVFQVEANGNIDDLKQAVKKVCQDDLGSLPHYKLAVYEPGVEFPPKEEDKLDPGDAVSKYATNNDSKNPLRVVVPVNQSGKN